jgi:transcriptional regulator with XRE-family HTH domain
VAKKNPGEFEHLRKRLGKNIQKARKKAGLTQEQMADEPDPIQIRAYQYIEAGEQNITFDRLARLARKFGCSIESLFKGI